MRDREKNTARAGVKAKLGPADASPALRKLLNNNSRRSREFEESQLKYRERLERIKNKLRQPGTFQGGLSRLISAGANGDRLLHILAIEVLGRSMPREVTREKTKIKALAKRLRNITSEVEKAYLSEATYSDEWSIAIHALYDGSVQKNAPVWREWIRSMRVCADDLEEKARALGQLAKNEIPHVKSQAVKILLAEVHATTGDARRHVPLIAELLVAAYATCGIQKRRTPSAGSLKKYLTRYVLPRMQK